MIQDQWLLVVIVSIFALVSLIPSVDAAHNTSTPYTDLENNVTAEFHRADGSVTINWDLGNNPDRKNGCQSDTYIYLSDGKTHKTTTYTHYDMLGYKGTSMQDAKTVGGDNMFFGTNNPWVRWVVSDDTDNFIDCKGSITITPSDFKTRSFPNATHFGFGMSFFDEIKTDYKDNYPIEQFRIQTPGDENVRALNKVVFSHQNFKETKALTCYSVLVHHKMLSLSFDINGERAETITYPGCHAGPIITPPVITVKPVIPPTTQQQSSGDKKESNSNNPPPTLGVDNNGKRFVHDGIIINDESFQVELYKTHVPMQYTELYKTNHVHLTIYENSGSQNIEMVQLGLGVKEIGTPISEAQARIEISPDFFADDIENPELKDITLHDLDGIVNEYRVDIGLTSCGEEFLNKCLTLDIFWDYKKAPNYPVLMVNTYDYQRATFNDYFNDGLGVIVDEIPEIIEEPYKPLCNDPPLETIMNGGDRNNCHWRVQLVAMWK